MSATAPAQESLDLDRQPQRRLCADCGEPVLVVVLRGREVDVEIEEVMPPTPCPLCRAVEAKKQERGPWCWKCGGTGMTGDPLPQPGVAVNADGGARHYGGRRQKGEAVHRPHVCVVVSEAEELEAASYALALRR